ncbi:MAG: GNAT family N-acetyltransferase [Elusimicrobia bacterium CG_4_10_14_0_2_um_filter_56_8]|nr:MAG: GNAT family N-acetyltransferase [Elusimicrobia bacterium CG1_02_56_21]PJA13353.1 MAG: GNAT family N-acetyltransferase [Elusimicrobia bacterium CG_4_10_14_0_2_um_filter_56_8]
MKNSSSAVIIRAELKSDFDAIRKLNKKAFKGKNESKLIDAVRESSCFIPALSMVAVKDGVVVGHILFTPVRIKSPQTAVPALALAPMSVLPELQNRGIGTALVKKGLEESVKSGHKIVVVVGHPEYYPRFGFVAAGGKGLKLPFEAPEEVFMVLELARNALKDVSGEIEYPKAFHDIN